MLYARDQLTKMESAVRDALQGRGGTIVGVREEMKTVQKPVGTYLGTFIIKVENIK